MDPLAIHPLKRINPHIPRWCSTPCPACVCGGTRRYRSRAKVFEPKCPPHHTTIMDGFNDPSHKYAWNIQYTTGQKSALGIVRVSHNQDNNSVTWIFKSGAHARSFKTTHGPPTMVRANWNKGKVPQRQHARFLDRVKYPESHGIRYYIVAEWWQNL